MVVLGLYNAKTVAPTDHIGSPYIAFTTDVFVERPSALNEAFHEKGQLMWPLIVSTMAIILLGVAHHFGLLLVRGLVQTIHGLNGSVITAFAGLLVLHVSEILGFAGLYAALIAIDPGGIFAGDPTATWDDLVYLSAMAFTTLGYAQLEVQSAVRLVVAFEALGGFMVLTWSATFLYSVCRTTWSNDGA